MATISDCRAAVGRLADQLARNAEARGKIALDRSLSLDITDLGAGFHGRLAGGELVDIADGTNPDAKIRLSANSDDLIAMVDGRMPFAQAWAKGQVSVKASIFDLVKLRSLV